MTDQQPEPDPFAAAVALQIAVDELTQPGTVELQRDIPVAPRPGEAASTAYQLAADDAQLIADTWADLRHTVYQRDLDATRRLVEVLVLTERRRTARTAPTASLPSLLQQLQDAIPNSGESSGSSPSSRSRSPLALAALDLCADIARTVGARRPSSPNLASQVHAWVHRVASDETQVFTAAERAAIWPERGRTILDPPKRWTTPGACPQCGNDTAWVEQDGERVRRPAIEFDIPNSSARCLVKTCPAKWDGETELRQLEKVLTTAGDPPS